MKKLSKVVRLTHMYVALFLTPWMLMYALSTLVMTHQEYVNSFYASKSPVMVKERELDYSRSFPTNLTRDAIAQQILNDLEDQVNVSVAAGAKILTGGKRVETDGDLARGHFYEPTVLVAPERFQRRAPAVHEHEHRP